MIGLVTKITKEKLEIADLYITLDQDKSRLLGDTLEKNWEDEIARAKLENGKPSLIRSLYKTFFITYMLWGIPFFIQNVIFRSIQPIVLARLICLFKEAGAVNTEIDMYVSSVVLIGFGFLIILMTHHTSHSLAVIGMRVRVATSSLVYRTMTRLSRESLGQTAAGHVVNLLSNDVNRFDSLSLYLHALWAMPFQIAVMSYFIWQQVEISCLVGILSMIVVSLPIQSYIGRVCGNLRQFIAEKTDKRVKLMSGVISGIQIIKMYAWEKSFEKVIKTARASEIDDITYSSYLRGILLSFMGYSQRTTLFITVMCYVLLGNVITADKVFSMAQFFNILQITIALQYPSAITFGSEASTSVKRLEKFLILRGKKSSNYEISEGQGIILTNVSACWVPENYTLKHITLRIQPGSLCAIIGPVGTGKSSFLQLLLGELSAESGKICIEGEVSYSSQEPWLFSSTIRNNILFGQTYDETLYLNTVRVCCLERDFEQFPNGDMTIVGDRGVTLSGGQKARVNLARAVYRKTNIYLMDDPLSAVDSHVGKHLFEECIVEYLKGKTRVLVTHQLQYLNKADLIIVINQGVIEAQGTLAELSKSGVNFTEMLVDENTADESDPETTHSEVYAEEKNILFHQKVMGNIKNTINEDIDDDTKMFPLKEFFKSAKSKYLLAVFIFFVLLSQAFCTGVDYWTSFWTQQEDIRHTNRRVAGKNPTELNRNSSLFSYQTYSTGNLVRLDENTSTFFEYIEVDNTTHTLVKTDYSIAIYGILIIVTIILCIIRNMIFFKLCMTSSKKLHSKMLHILMQAPMRFFHTNSCGGILNRFSKDMGAVDEIFPGVLCHSIQIALTLAGILINIAISNPFMIVVIIVLGCGFLKISQLYISTAAAVKRLESTAKSPVFSHINSTLNGMTTIRASKVEQLLINEFDEHQDVHSSAWYLTLSCSYSFGLWFDLVCIILTACVSFSFVVIHTTITTVNSSSVGLAISQCLMMTGMLQFGMRQLADVIQQLISVERILQYTKLDTEGPFETPEGTSLSKSWPDEGRIEFKNLSLKYAKDDPEVLKNLNFVVEPGRKVGIVGRTGAGKSSIIAALFRLAPTEGSIFIDGVDTKNVGLSDLRKKISIIPQEPILFSASLRYNLDPFNEIEDDKLWEVLAQVELKEVVDSLDFMVTEGGNNFSSGQKQLICLARAILRKNKILVLDEATANVDQRTDSLIQKTIREKFSDCTVLTIAHRLNTIMDADEVLVISFGKILEFDHPHELIQRADGHFREMVAETGPVIASQLRDIAFEAYRNQETVEQNTKV
ncbi:ATP-binding cassette sub-family C member 4 isoform X2 [Leptinotarsa decemlineata]